MKRTLISLLAGVAILVSTLAVSEGDELAAVKAKFAERFPQIDPRNIHAGPLDGFLEIRQGTLIAYLTEDGRYLFQGALIDLNTNEDLTETAASAERKNLMDASNQDAMIVFGPEKPAHTVTVFTDIDCTFCRKLHREMAQYTAAGIEIKYLLYPRSGPGSPSWTKAEDVLCAKNPNQAITAAKNDQLVIADSCPAANLVYESYKLGQLVGLRGTPAMVLDDGELISGYLSPKDLSRKLAQEASSSGE